jgi:hypothetical protein
MATNPILIKGLDIAQCYYGTQQYFSSLILAAEGVAHRLGDQGWRITSWNYGRPVYVDHWSWSGDRGAHLPRCYKVLFEPGTAPTGQAMDAYGFCLWFFTSDPSGGQRWAPTGFFFRATLRQGGTFQHWIVVPKMAEEVRTTLVSPHTSTVFLHYAAPWPSTLEGNGVDQQMQSMDVVPFPLASITTSEDLDAIRDKAMQALAAGDPNILLADTGYLQRVWAL